MIHSRTTPNFSAAVLLWCMAAIFTASPRAVGSDDAAKSNALAELRLTDISGKHHQPFAAKGIKAAVLIFVSTDCPVANAFQPSLREFERTYTSKGIRCFMVYCAPGTTQDDIAKHVQDFSIQMPAVLDTNQAIGKLAGAKVTPEAVLIDRAGKVRYRGMINNLYAGYGRKRAAANQHHLRDACDALIDNRQIQTPVTKPIGCFIHYEAASSQETTRSKYDPLKTHGTFSTIETEFTYARKKRVVPLKIYLPTGRSLPVLLFSHGLGGSRDGGSQYLGNHWAGRGYAVVCMEHIGSNTDVIKDLPPRKKFGALAKAANVESTMNRFRDVKETISHIEALNVQGKFAGRFNMQKVGMSGHSFGAITTQGISGQSYGRLGRLHTDKRVKAAVALSPSPPKSGNSSEAFEKVNVPWLLMTGTKDVGMIRRSDAENRRIVFRELPKSGHFYEVVLDGAEHMAFSDRTLVGRPHRNPNHHKAIKAISTAFWDTYLRDDASAREWLTKAGPRAVLAKADLWNHK